jgi:hypothetical protein
MRARVKHRRVAALVWVCRAQLVDEAYQRWLTEEEGVVDDITAVVVRFVHPGE